jgi:hypothetical protein
MFRHRLGLVFTWGCRGMLGWSRYLGGIRQELPFGVAVCVSGGGCQLSLSTPLIHAVDPAAE